MRLRHRRKKNYKKLGILLTLVLALVVGYFIYKAFSFFSNISVGKPGKSTVTKTPEQKDTYNILLMGYGGKRHEGAYLTDTMIVIHADLKQKKAIIISIPRDIWVKVPTTSDEDFHSKINSVYQMGLFPQHYPGVDKKYTRNDKTGLTKHILSEMLGFPIDAYLAVDFDGFMKIIDVLDGVDIDVERSFTDYKYPVEGKEDDLCGKKEEELPELEKIATESPVLAFPCRYENLKFEAGPTHMDGQTALKYARSRHSLEDGGDFNRAARQQKVLQAVKEKILSFGVVTKIFPLMDELDNYVETDMPASDIQKFLPQLPQLGEYKTESLVLSEDNYLESSFEGGGQYVLVPSEGKDNWTALREDIKNMRMGITPTPTAEPDAPSTTKPTKPSSN